MIRLLIIGFINLSVGCSLVDLGERHREQNGIAQCLSSTSRTKNNENGELDEVNLNLGRVSSPLFGDVRRPLFLYVQEVGDADFSIGDTNRFLELISRSHQLERLDIAGLNIVNSLDFCRQLKHLKYLDLSFTKIAEDELFKLRDCRQLEVLYLAGNGYSSNVLETIKTLKFIRVLGLDGIDLTKNEVSDLVNSLPLLETIYNRGNPSAQDIQPSGRSVNVVTAWQGGGVL